MAPNFGPNIGVALGLVVQRAAGDAPTVSQIIADIFKSRTGYCVEDITSLVASDFAALAVAAQYDLGEFI